MRIVWKDSVSRTPKTTRDEVKIKEKVEQVEEKQKGLS